MKWPIQIQDDLIKMHTNPTQQFLLHWCRANSPGEAARVNEMSDNDWNFPLQVANVVDMHEVEGKSKVVSLLN